MTRTAKLSLFKGVSFLVELLGGPSRLNSLLSLRISCDTYFRSSATSFSSLELASGFLGGVAIGSSSNTGRLKTE